MSRNLRVVVDTSTLVSAALYTGSVPDLALTKVMDYFDLCASAETLAELEQVLDRRKFDRYRERDARIAFVTTIRRHSHLFAVDLADLSAVDPPCRDPKDNHFLALAQVAEADLLISSDTDLLILHPWRGIPIVTPADFLAQLIESSQG